MIDKELWAQFTAAALAGLYAAPEDTSVDYNEMPAQAVRIGYHTMLRFEANLANAERAVTDGVAKDLGLPT